MFQNVKCYFLFCACSGHCSFCYLLLCVAVLALALTIGEVDKHLTPAVFYKIRFVSPMLKINVKLV